MGQSNSVAQEIDPTSPVEPDTDAQNSDASGLVLSPKLMQEIQRDFANAHIQNAWSGFRDSVLTNHEKRMAEFHAWQVQNEANRQALAKKYQQQHDILDERIDILNNKFSDMANELEYNTKQLMQKHEKLINNSKREDLLDSKPLPCLGPRAHWMDCQKKQGNFGACDQYLQILQQCVNDRIFAQSAPTDEATKQ